MATGSDGSGASSSDDHAPIVPTSPARVRELLDRYGVRPSRALGQNFLADANLAAKIVRLAGVSAGDRVVEVGPGAGSLTLALSDAGARVSAIELDRHLLPVLEAVLAGRDVEIVHADALSFDWSSVADCSVMVSNLPYNVATPVVLRALDEAPGIGRFLVMVQREVGERMVAAPGSRTYGAVSVKIAYHARAEIAGRVGADVFVPRPRVDSVLVRLDRHTRPQVGVERDLLFSLVEAGFAVRRKTLRNSLKAVLGAEAEATLTRAGIDPQARAEQLGLVDWASVASAIEPG